MMAESIKQEQEKEHAEIIRIAVTTLGSESGRGFRWLKRLVETHTLYIIMVDVVGHVRDFIRHSMFEKAALETEEESEIVRMVERTVQVLYNHPLYF